MYLNPYIGVQHLRPSAVRPGGYCWVYFTPIENIDQWPVVNPSNGMAYTPITLKPGKTWFEFKVPDSERFFRESEKKTPSGPLFEITLQGYLPGNDTNQTINSAVMPMHQHVVLFKDRDGQVRFIGSPDRGADCETSYTSGDFNTSRRRDYTFKWAYPFSAPIYAGSLSGIFDEELSVPASNGSFNNDFNSDFDI